MLKLIVNADDLGLCEAVNEGIAEAHLSGIVTSASIIANGSGFDHAVRLCHSIPALDLGIHLTLVEEEPLLRAASIPSLVDQGGRLHRNARTFVQKYLSGGIRLEEVRSELEAQVQKVLSRGLCVSHLDSHQHVHMLPQILAMTIDLARKYNIPAIRIPRERVRPYMLKRAAGLLRVCELVVLNTFCRIGRNRSVRRTDHFVGFCLGGRLHKKNLQALLDYLPLTGTCELMCHPGKDDRTGLYGHWGYQWTDELRALVDPDISKCCFCKRIQLISYRELGQASPTA